MRSVTLVWWLKTAEILHWPNTPHDTGFKQQLVQSS